MTSTVSLPLWLLILILGFAGWAALDRVLLPSVRWYFRRRLEKAVAQLNTRLARPIQPFKLARRHDMIQRLRYDAEVLDAVAEHAEAEGIPEAVAMEQAHRYAREIVPSFSAAAYFGIAIRWARRAATSLYRVRLGHINEDALAAIDPEATVVFVMNHRSNMDYVLVTYLVAERSALSYAVGEWARVWPLRALIRAMGAYFIRRKSRGLLYRKVLARYVALATAGGVTQAMFPEGGLSLDGNLAPPKLGLLNYIAEAESPRPTVFVPVALAYDRVLEDRVLLAAGEAGDRRFRARMSVVAKFLAKQLWLRLTGRFYRFGYAAVSFGRPLVLEEFTGDTEALGAELMRRVDHVMPVLPVPLVANALLRADGPLSESALQEQVKAHMQALSDSGAHLHIPRDDPGYAVEVGLRNLRLRHLLDETEEGIVAKPSEHGLLRYYANALPQSL